MIQVKKRRVNDSKSSDQGFAHQNQSVPESKSNRDPIITITLSKNMFNYCNDWDIKPPWGNLPLPAIHKIAKLGLQIENLKGLKMMSEFLDFTN